MSEFFVGQRVVCVDDVIASGVYYGTSELPKRGVIYTVRAVIQDGRGLQLEEIKRQFDKSGDGYLARRFRPLEYKAMSIFRKIAADPSIKISEDA